MRTRRILHARVLFAACALTACTTTSAPAGVPAGAASTVAPTCTPPSSQLQGDLVLLGPGIYGGSEPGALPFPTCGYEVYLLGELQHGAVEDVGFFLAYLRALHRMAGLRDVVLEGAGPAWQREINGYVLARSDATGPWYTGRREILDGVRAFNGELAEAERVRVHMVDIHAQPETIHAHLLEVRDQMGPEALRIEIPPLSEFQQWSEVEMLALVDRLARAAGDPDPASGVATVRASIRYHFALEKAERGEVTTDACYEIREERIAQNVQDLLAALGGRPLLSLYGGWHAQKRQAMLAVTVGSQLRGIAVRPWAQRLAESGVAIHSLLVGGISGAVRFRGQLVAVHNDPAAIRFADGSTLGALIGPVPGRGIVYVDLRATENASVSLLEGFSRPGGVFDPDVPAGAAFDAIVLFREVTPTRW